MRLLERSLQQASGPVPGGTRPGSTDPASPATTRRALARHAPACAGLEGPAAGPAARPPRAPHAPRAQGVSPRGPGRIPAPPQPGRPATPARHRTARAALRPPAQPLRLSCRRLEGQAPPRCLRHPPRGGPGRDGATPTASRGLGRDTLGPHRPPHRAPGRETNARVATRGAALGVRPAPRSVAVVLVAAAQCPNAPDVHRGGGARAPRAKCLRPGSAQGPPCLARGLSAPSASMGSGWHAGHPSAAGRFCRSARSGCPRPDGSCGGSMPRGTQAVP